MKDASSLSTKSHSADEPDEGLAVSKVTAYAVIDGDAGLKASKLVAYAVVEDGEKSPEASPSPE